MLSLLFGVHSLPHDKYVSYLITMVNLKRTLTSTTLDKERIII